GLRAAVFSYWSMPPARAGGPGGGSGGGHAGRDRREFSKVPVFRRCVVTARSPCRRDGGFCRAFSSQTPLLGLALVADPNILWRAGPSYAAGFAKSTFIWRPVGQSRQGRDGRPGKSPFRWARASGPTLPGPGIWCTAAKRMRGAGLPAGSATPMYRSPLHPSVRSRPMRPAPTLLVLAAAAAFGGFAATAIRDVVQTPARAGEPVAAALPVPTMAALPAAVDGQALPSLAPMLKRVTPSVVSVQAAQRRQVSPFGNDPFFRRMFPELSQERIARSLGSGVIVDAANGYVLTNRHVIENADEVSVTLADGRTLEAEFIGSDPDTDVALMRIAAEDLTALPLASGTPLAVGDFVVAVGNPFGVGQTVTSGIVSAV